MEERSNRYRGLLTVLLLILVAAGAMLWLLRRPEARSVEIVSPTQPSKQRERIVKVYVNGEVVNPGVYALNEGDRVEDALRAAGGATGDADRTRLNLAARVQDQQQIYVPPVGPAKEPGLVGPDAQRAGVSAAPIGATKVNINAASAAELDALPGIGPVTIQKILSYREQSGPFKTIEELKDAKIVTNAQFEQIKDRVTAP